MNETDNITLLAQVVMEDHELLMKLSSKIDTMQADVQQFRYDTQAQFNRLFEMMERTDHRLNAIMPLTSRHEKWIIKTAPIVGVPYPPCS